LRTLLWQNSFYAVYLLLIKLRLCHISQCPHVTGVNCNVKSAILLSLSAHFDRLRLFQCSTSELSWSWYTQRTFWKRL